MTKPSKKELEKHQAANKPKAPPKTPVKPPVKVVNPKVSPVKAMKEVVAKKVPAKEIEQATKSVTTHDEHVDIAKLAYQHLHEEEKFAKPPNPIHDAIQPLEKVEPSIPVHSVAIAPQGAAEPNPYPRTMVPTALSTEPLPVTKEGKLKWSDMKARLPSQR